MSTRSTWLQGVENILKAETGDLKKLAEIGGENPKYMYIGTRLDGVDVRGQNLQDMIFTNLDVKKIKIDQKTIIDAPLAEKSPEEDQRFISTVALIYLSEMKFFEDFHRKVYRKFPGVLIYGPDQEEEFRRDGELFDGPKLILLEHNKRGGLEHRLDRSPGGAVTIVARRGGSFELDDDELDAAFYAAPVILCPLATAPLSAPPVMAGSVLDLMNLLIKNWDLAQLLEDAYPASVFVRSRGIKPDPSADAWTKLLGRMQQIRVIGRSGLRFSARIDNADAEMAHALLPEYTLVPANIDVASAALFDAGVLVDIGSRSARPLAYTQAIANLFQLRGWDVRGSPSAQHESIVPDFRIFGKNRSFDVIILESFPRVPQTMLVYRWGAHPNFEQVERVVVTEAASERATFNRLVEASELWVNARDVANFDVGAETIWGLIASQLRRVARAADPKGRTQYLAAIVIEALRRGAVEGDHPWALDEALEAPNFLDRFVFSCTPYYGPLGVYVTSIKLTDVERLPGSGPEWITMFELAVDDAGPRIVFRSDWTRRAG